VSESLPTSDPGTQKRRSTRVVQAVPISVSGVRRTRPAVQRADDHRDGELPRLQIPIQALRPEKFRRYAGNTSDGACVSAANRAGARRLGAEAADGAGTVSNWFGI